MQPSWKWKFWGTLAAVVLSLYILTPSFFSLGESDGIPPSFLKFFPNKNINLGLDLRGGMYLEMDVDLVEAMKRRLDILQSQIERASTDEGIESLKITRDYNSNELLIELVSSDQEKFLALYNKSFSDAFDRFEPRASDRIAFTGLKLNEDYQKNVKEFAVRQALEAVRNRIDRYGVVEASIQKQGEGHIVIELPGVKDPESVINVIRKTGLLEFRLVDPSQNKEAIQGLVQKARSELGVGEDFTKESSQKINEYLGSQLPKESEVLFELQRDPVTKKIVGGIPYLVERRSNVTGDMLENSQVGVQNNEPYVSLSFNRIGKKNFGDVTKENQGKQLAIVLDSVIYSAPVIKEPILDGQAQISLGFGAYEGLMKEAEDLTLILREGALPTSLNIATKTIIGPSLGADSIRKGLVSLVVAGAVIVVFMIFYYKWGGLLSSVALGLNVMFIFSLLALFQASLTLPGMAGVILTLGMAVDANIIIFERMREEIALGKTAKSVVESGYGHAMSAIVDANITSLIAGIVLYQFGTGPIKGFAITLMIGILTTLFTAIVVTRLVYDYFIFSRKINRVVI